MATKKITELTATTNVAANSVFLVVDPSGPTTLKIAFSDMVNSIPSNANFAANVAVTGTLAATGNVTVDTAKFLVANNVLLKKGTTPANTNDVLNSSSVGLIWSDGSYIYFQSNTTTVKRVAISTW